EVCFTSSRDESEGTEMHGATGESFTDIYFSRQDRKGKWSTPVPLEEPINTEFEDGTPSISPDFNTMYFTRCKMSKNKNFGCQILSATKSGENWGKAQEIEIAGDSITIAHPAISPDNLTLYFVSDMDGGAGGKDIWKITRESANGNWADPENLGEPINTDQDEVFPYVHPDGTLYFSSNGHIGMGGLDIFKATENEDGKWEVENMKTPINSASDDFGIVFQADEERGFFSSSRGLRNNDDIYAFVLPPLKFNIEGVVKDEKTEEPLDNVLVKSIGSDGITLESTTGKKGEFKFMLRPNTDYVFLASREGYLRGKERETTKGLGKSKDFNTTIFLASIDKPIQLPNIFYDFNKADLRPESMVTLDRLVETLNDNPNVTIEIMSHTDYRGSDSFNDELSQKRAQSVVNYLIEKGIAPDRLSAKGYGETRPKTIDSKIAEEWPFFEEGVTLTEAYIKSLKSLEQQEVANQINRITEFRVLSTDYKQK
ncbi:MAG: OmpA family protein, partial [Bacteroidota bacterium]